MGRDQGPRAVTVPTVAAGATTTIINSACRLCGWSLGDAGNPPGVQALDTAIAAAAAGSLTLTFAISVALVRVTPAAAWPAGVNQVTLTNVAGGTQTVDIEGGTDNAAELLFPIPLPTTGTPVVSVPAIVGGPAYTIEAEFTATPAAPQAGLATCQLVDGAQVLGLSAPLSGVTDTQWLADQGIYISTAVAIKCIAGAVSGCIYVIDGSDMMSDDEIWLMRSGSST
jgi:hypothetical protein